MVCGQLLGELLTLKQSFVSQVYSYELASICTLFPCAVIILPVKASA